MTVFVFKIHRMPAFETLHIDTCLSHLLDFRHRTFAYFGDELERHFLWQLIHAIGKIERCSSGHIDRLSGCDNLISGHMPYTTYILHYQSLLIYNNHYHNKIMATVTILPI